MLSPLEADIWQRDRALPGLATVLDPKALLRGLTNVLPEVDVKTLRVTYVRHKLGRRCTVTYAADAGGGTLGFFATAYSTDRQGKLRRAREQPGVPGPFGPGRVVLEELCIVVTFFPNDSRLVALPLLRTAESRKQILQHLFPEHAALWEGNLERLRYRPERRYVAKITTSGEPRAVMRFYTACDYQRARQALSVLEPRGQLRLASLTGWSDTHHALALDWLPGHPLVDGTPGANLDHDTVSRVGAALAELHCQNPERLRGLKRRSEAEHLDKAVAAVEFIAPQYAVRTEKLAQRLGPELADAPCLGVPIHGDFHPKQVLLAEDKVGIIDLDGAACGDAAADLGVFIAHLERDALRGHLASDRVPPIRRALLEGYGSIRNCPSLSRINKYVAARLLRRLPYCFRHREPNWPDRMEALLERAEAISAEDVTSISKGCAKSQETGYAGAERNIPRVDPFGIAADPKMRFLAEALDPMVMTRHLKRAVRAIRVRRHKPGRRCLIEYELDDIVLLGKVRAKGLDASSHHLMASLRNAGFDGNSEEGVSVPTPYGVIPELQMWLQEKVSGAPATDLLSEPGGVALAERIAEAIHQLHLAALPACRRHTMRDELGLLRAKLALVALEKPRWTQRLARILEACYRLGALSPRPATITPSGTATRS